jgi:hypothetical protein
MKVNKFLAATAIVGTIIGVTGISVAAAESGSHTKTVTNTVTVPGPVRVIPGPTVTKTAPPPAPQAGQIIATYHGNGNDVTPEFNVPADGNYLVTWQFSDNGDGFGNGDNFIIDNTGDGDGSSLANDIAISGHGTGEVQGAGSTDSLTVQSGDNCSWTLTIKGD